MKVPREVLADTLGGCRGRRPWQENKGNPAFSDKKLARLQFAAALADAGTDVRALRGSGGATRAGSGNGRVVDCRCEHARRVAGHVGHGACDVSDAKDAWNARAGLRSRLREPPRGCRGSRHRMFPKRR
jgi:hypothetical protein